MIHLYTAATPNGFKAAIMLEETGLPYTVEAIDIGHGGTQTPDYLAMNPNGKIPVIRDEDTGRVVLESGAILLYLAEKSGQLRPEPDDRTLEWMFFQTAHVGPMLGQLGYFKMFAAEKIPAAIARFEKEADRVLHVLDTRLGHSAHLGRETYGLADIMNWPWVRTAATRLGFDLATMPNLKRWFDSVAERPAVQKGLLVPAPAG